MGGQTYTERAEHCETMAARLRDPEARQCFLELAKTWRLQAQQAEALDLLSRLSRASKNNAASAPGGAGELRISNAVTTSRSAAGR
jgi:hypothetical protein